MKIVKIANKQTKLLNLNALKTKINSLKKKHLNYALKKDLEFRFKNALNIIFKFHSQNKKILFIGTPIKLTKQLKELFKNTNHSFIPEKIWLSGILTNTKSIFRFLFKKYYKKSKNNLAFLFNLTVKNNLIVILNESLTTNSLKEFSKKRIPTISLNYTSVNLNSYNSSYRIKQNLSHLENKSMNNFFFSILTTTLKKAEKVRIKVVKFNLELKKLMKLIKLKKKNKKFYKKFYKKNVFFKKKQV